MSDDDLVHDALRVIQLATRWGISMSERIREIAEHDELANNTALTVLIELDAHGPKRPGQLAEITRLSSGGMTKLLDRLASTGHLTRAYGEDPSDRRAVSVVITDDGRRFLRQAGEIIHREIADNPGPVKELGLLLSTLVDDATDRPN